MTSTARTIKGGAWLLEDTLPSDVFTPEKRTDEQRLMAQTTDEFVEGEVLPNIARMETKDWAFARQLLRRCAELGLLGVDVPEEYGGLALDTRSSTVVAEHISRSASFGVTFGGQANLCILPIVLFGTDAQKQKYLPRLISAEIVGAYALSESGSGSDALAAKTQATRNADGSWTLTGEKMWISNGGFADIFIVFAQVDGSHFTAFIVERAFPGVSSGKEEHKMGLHGSSTTAVLLQSAQVPAENVLGEIGKGHKVALNTLNFGRFKLGATCVGGCRNGIGEAARYAAQRKQFGQSIASFGAIKHKLGEMTVRTYALESLIYRTAGLIDAAIDARHQANHGAAAAAAFEELAVESSIAKVVGSETLNYVVDENVQIHGGNGFVKDYTAERHYRDARVNRIFEGTNEINRQLIPGMLARRAVKGDLPLLAAARKLQEELSAAAATTSAAATTLAADAGAFGNETRLVNSFRKVALMVLGAAMQKFGDGLADQQEVLTVAADILSDTYAAESVLLRALDASASSLPNASLHEKAARVFMNDAALRIEAAARNALAATLDGDMLATTLAALRRVLVLRPINTVALRRELAEAATSRGAYPLR